MNCTCGANALVSWESCGSEEASQSCQDLFKGLVKRHGLVDWDYGLRRLGIKGYSWLSRLLPSSIVFGSLVFRFNRADVYQRLNYTSRNIHFYIVLQNIILYCSILSSVRYSTVVELGHSPLITCWIQICTGVVGYIAPLLPSPNKCFEAVQRNS